MFSLMRARKRELYTSDPYARAERHLMSVDWEQLVADIDFADVVVPMSYARKHEPLERYRLAPIQGRANHRPHPRSIDNPYFSYDFPEDVSVQYWHEDLPGQFITLPCPPLDTQRGMLLVYKNRGIGLAAVCIDDTVRGDQPAQLLIKQCQGLIRDKWDPEHSQGLRGGFFWRDTLFGACEKIGMQIEGVGSIAVRTAATMSYASNRSPAPVERLAQNYDDVADRCGFDPNIAEGYWIKPIIPE